MNDNIKAGADIHAGDGGYSIGTKEGYEAFAKVRNQSLAKARIKELAREAGGEFYEGFAGSTNFVKFAENDLEKFAELIVRECLNQCYNRGMNDELYAGQLKAATYIEEHFGVEN